MSTYCISSYSCQYRSTDGNCTYTGNGCAQGLVKSVRITDPAEWTIVRKVDLSDDSINKIVDAVSKSVLDATNKIEVVRCKNCKYHTFWCSYFETRTQPYDYCSYGESINDV